MTDRDDNQPKRVFVRSPEYGFPVSCQGEVVILPGPQEEYAKLVREASFEWLWDTNKTFLTELRKLEEKRDQCVRWGR